MLNRLPKNPGTLDDLAADLGVGPNDWPKVAKALGVSVRTLRRWRTGKTPRVALLSLWWLSREGYSTWDAEAFNLCQLHQAHARSLSDEVNRLRGLLVLLLGLGDFGSANDPLDGLRVGFPVFPNKESGHDGQQAKANDNLHPRRIGQGR